jgi:single-strand DNA-binding protein
MNRVVLIGRLTRDPDYRVTQAGTPVCTFTLAVDRRFARRNEENNQPTADFIPIVTWGKTAEFCNQYFRKGNKMCVEGRIQTRNYEAQDGTKRYVTEVIADGVEFVESKKYSDGDYNGGYSRDNNTYPDSSDDTRTNSKSDALGSAAIANDEIPF